MSTELWNLSCIMFVLGIICAAAGIVLKYRGMSQERYRGHAEARVVDIVMEPQEGTYSLSQFYNKQTAVFEFFAEGKLIKVKDSSEAYLTPYRMNQKVKILYNPKNPEQFCVAGINRWMMLARGANAGAVVCLAAGCVFFLMHAARIEL